MHTSSPPLGFPSYSYTTDLLTLAADVNPSSPALPSSLCKITTPLDREAWEALVAAHPDRAHARYIIDGTQPNRAYACYIIDGISNGFHIGFAFSTHTFLSAHSNHPSAREHPKSSPRLATEIAKSHLVGPLDRSDLPYVQISSLGTVPKKHTRNKWRLILDLSHPQGNSINDGIARTLCSLIYMHVDDVVQHILQTGKGSLLAKIDIESVFHNVPVHPQDRHLLRMLWDRHLLWIPHCYLVYALLPKYSTLSLMAFNGLQNLGAYLTWSIFWTTSLRWEPPGVANAIVIFPYS